MIICIYWAVEDIVIVIKFFKYDILKYLYIFLNLLAQFSNSISNDKYKLNILNIHVLSWI